MISFSPIFPIKDLVSSNPSNRIFKNLFGSLVRFHHAEAFYRSCVKNIRFRREPQLADNDSLASNKLENESIMWKMGKVNSMPAPQRLSAVFFFSRKSQSRPVLHNYTSLFVGLLGMAVFHYGWQYTAYKRLLHRMCDIGNCRVIW